MSQKEIDKALKAVKKVHGEASALRLTEDRLRSEVEEVIPTGLDAFDWYGLQIGGLAVGRISEIWSDEGKGKTSFGLTELAACQRDGGVSVLVEVEHALTDERVKTFGLDRESLIVFEPESLEQGLGQIGTFLDALPKTVGPILFVWDSLASTLVEEELKQGPDGKPTTPGAMARVMSMYCRRLLPVLAEKRGHLQFINQIRHKIGVMFGSPETTPGGNALKFYASQRMRIGSGEKIGDSKRQGEQVGHQSRFVVKKNRFGYPHREVNTRLMYDEGWDNDWTNLRLAKSWGLIPPNSSSGDKAKAALKSVHWSAMEAAKLKAKSKGK